MNFRMCFLSLGLLVPVEGHAAAAAPADASPTDAAVRDLGREWLVANDGVGLSIGVYDNGQRHFYNFGATRLDGNKTPTKDTVYEIGSIAKTMTGQLLARAIVEGRATINDEASKYLDEPYPNLENGGERVRLLHLANMTSQLADNIPDLSQVRTVPGEFLFATRMRVLEKYTRTEFLRQLHMVKPQRPPGSDPAHSNVASMLLGVVLEKLYGESFDAILAREIEKPLKMGSGTAPPIKLLALGYTKNNEQVPGFTAETQYAAGSLRYSAEDLLRYASWQAAERDASVKLAHQPTWLTLDRRQSVAFYWIVDESPHGRRLRYTGGTYGFSSACELYPDAGIALVLLSNKAADGAQESLRALSAKIVELMAPVDLLKPAGSLSPQPSSADAPPPGR
ncbi:MAG TPA: serine hydrolase domain-containing protein [Steroidobacteraceae bacterium]|jgi:CubicO group peptidase (beta-lactamase class C family)|nr:serine hydrolase domain-containing protein [Steroidobacteraceae bacterium]